MGTGSRSFPDLGEELLPAAHGHHATVGREQLDEKMKNQKTKKKVKE